MTSCSSGANYDWIGVGTSGSASGPEESGGIFIAGVYEYTIVDTYGDSLNGNAAVHFETVQPALRCMEYNSNRVWLRWLRNLWNC